jgi:drug/metabolite transporter (DMT)-like permease
MDLSLILNLVLVLAIVGGVLYLFNMLPLDATVKKVANVLAIFVIVIWAIRWLMHQFH